MTAPSAMTGLIASLFWLKIGLAIKVVIFVFIFCINQKEEPLLLAVRTTAHAFPEDRQVA